MALVDTSIQGITVLDLRSLTTKGHFRHLDQPCCLNLIIADHHHDQILATIDHPQDPSLITIARHQGQKVITTDHHQDLNRTIIDLRHDLSFPILTTTDLQQ